MSPHGRPSTTYFLVERIYTATGVSYACTCKQSRDSPENGFQSSNCQSCLHILWLLRAYPIGSQDVTNLTVARPSEPTVLLCTSSSGDSGKATSTHAVFSPVHGGWSIVSGRVESTAVGFVSGWMSLFKNVSIFSQLRLSPSFIHGP